jgi:hypothetical protein
VRLAVTAFLLGAAGIGAVALAATLVAVALADAGGRDALRVALGPLELASYRREPDGTVTAFGPGLLVVAVLGGVANAAAAVLLARGGRSA